jgi:hypothetical protein
MAALRLNANPYTVSNHAFPPTPESLPAVLFPGTAFAPPFLTSLKPPTTTKTAISNKTTASVTIAPITPSTALEIPPPAEPPVAVAEAAVELEAAVEEAQAELPLPQAVHHAL